MIREGDILMALRDIFKITRKTYFNPTAWLGYDDIKNQTSDIWNILSALFTPAKPTRTETFDQAVQRLELSEQDIHKTSQTYLAYAWVFGMFALLALLGGIYLIAYHGSGYAFVLAIVCAILFLAQTFRYHFWFFQMKHRKLGCTFDEWWQGKIKPSEGQQP